MFDEKGNIKGTLSSEGVIKDAEGKFIAQVLPNGDIVDENGNVIGQLGENGELPSDIESGLLVYANGNTFGKISGCDVLNLQNEKIASIMPNGSIIGLNGEIYATIQENGLLKDKDGNDMGKIKGLDLRLDKCGIKGLSEEELEALRNAQGGAGQAGTRRISFGNKLYQVTHMVLF